MRSAKLLVTCLAVALAALSGAGCPDDSNLDCSLVLLPCETLGVAQCTPDGTGVLRCQQDAAGCLAWVSFETCDTSETCVDGVCTCQADCAGRACGDDGCGGSCGLCDLGLACNADGQCETACEPECTGKECGDDGCGASCGECGLGEVCSEAIGQCLNCTPDCAGRVCGLDPLCGASCGECTGAGEVCVEASGTCQVCSPNCAGLECGVDPICGASCGTCGLGAECNAAGQCEAICVPGCEGRQCGDDGCDGSCGECDIGLTCNADGQCEAVCVPACEGRQCGGDGCDGSCGECDIGLTCNADTGQCEAVCVPACEGRQCGSDGCDGSCGQCAGAGEVCEEATGSCIVCTPNCAGLECGLDPVCGSSCGTCGLGAQCNAAGQCEPICVPQCEGKECGGDGCDGSCGECDIGLTCSADGLCVGCAPDCADRQCGPDGCNGSCGECDIGLTCSADGLCVGCAPDCQDRECGPDGCDGSCGECDIGLTCSADGLCVGCAPDCQDRECGPDGCNGSCGECDIGLTCSADGLCVGCAPDCQGRECGPDSCDGSCGTCGAGESCDAQGLCQPQGQHACDSASAIDQLGTYTGSTDAVASTDVGTCGGDGPEAVWDFTAPADGCVLVSTEGSEFDTVLYVRGDCLDVDSELGCNDDAVATQSEVQLQVMAGTVYSIFVDGYDLDSYGAYLLTLSDCGGGTEICDDGQDNDGDGLADCADPECAEFPACVTGDCCAAHGAPGCDDPTISDCVCAQDAYCCDTEWDDTCVGEVDSLGCGTCGGAAEICDDGADNDGDGAVDCADPDCTGDPACTGAEICDDGADNDGDGAVDCADPDCAAFPACLDYCPGYTGGNTCCQNSDPCGWAADGLCDCDGTCAWDVPDCGGTAEICDDGADNDGDGAVDCADPDCAADPACLDYCPGYTGGNTCCQNSDPCGWAADGLCDCDSTCAWDVPDCGGTPEICDDGADNDGDGLADCADPDCAADPACLDYCPGYTGGSTCCQNSDPCGWAADGICDCDSTCAWDEPDCGGTAEICDDGQDNDGDGLADCADPDCAADPACLDYCPGYTGGSSCCQNSDPCGWAADGICDCEGTCAWDVADCP